MLRACSREQKLVAGLNYVCCVRGAAFGRSFDEVRSAWWQKLMLTSGNLQEKLAVICGTWASSRLIFI
jgi:hypothetical protein